MVPLRARMVRNRIAPYREGIGVAKGMAGNAIRAEFKQGEATDQQNAEAEMGQDARIAEQVLPSPVPKVSENQRAQS